MQQGIDVKVVRFDREHGSQPFKGTMLNSYSMIVGDDMPAELPTQILERTSIGETLSYIGCVVEFSKPNSGAIANETIAKKERAKRSVVAKTTPRVQEPEPVVTPKRSRVAKQVEHAATVNKKIVDIAVDASATVKPKKTAAPTTWNLDFLKG